MPADGARVLEIWRDAVHATHDFLSAEHRDAIEQEVRDFLPKTPLWLATDDHDRPIGFMGLSGSQMDSLFIDPAHHGRGVGRALVEDAASLHPVLTTEVNEQNLQAREFYRRLGFVVIGRSATDGEGRPYPLLNLRRAAEEA